jgi:hypothetical protein
MSTHPFTPALVDGVPVEYCDRCGQHLRAHLEEPVPDNEPAAVAEPPAEAPVWPEPARLPVLPVTAVRGPGREPVYTQTMIAALAGLGENTIRVYRSRGDFPPPDGKVGNVPWWYADTVTSWLAGRRKPGNPAWRKGMACPGPRGGGTTGLAGDGRQVSAGGPSAFSPPEPAVDGSSAL